MGMRSSGKEMLASSMPPADEWSDVAVSTLLDCYNDKYIELNGGSIGTKGWQDVIFKLNSVCAQGKPVYSYRRCKNKLDVMKRRFKIERDRKATNGGISDWPWFQKMEEIVGRNPRLGAAAALVTGTIGNHFHQQQQQNHHHQPQTHPPQVQPSTLPLLHHHQEPDEQGLVGSGVLNSKQDHRFGSSSLQAAAQHVQDEISGGQLLSDQQDDNEDDDDDCQARNSSKACKKRKKGSACGSNPLRHAKEIARIVTEALERMELKRLEVMRELELKRNETQLQIARMIVESNARLQQQQQPQQHNRQPSTSSDPHSYVEQEH
ncbi:trihelix transcription factor ASIL2-like [Selaginella moellendorffii]|uniref:trihelix transcription factor ASIL2-like n=1 Tax=Selaginella moellendorffii TaxID=88036 RepID=UPI000D1C385B|nr:trihelix transcription factor ASIL2-like [Selaginella moellendorffii]|eukprot:XP_024540137.1 trihelix transcription factor ASIL2-like [Selaginella moellendorffii]